jgi:hypothetical protein
MAGASMQILFRVYAVLEEAGAEPAIGLLQNTFKLIATTQMIGLFFPTGLILLSIRLYKARLVKPFVPLLLASGAILFPVGRIAGLGAAVVGSDVLLISAFGLVGWHLLNRPEIEAPFAEENYATVN